MRVAIADGLTPSAAILRTGSCRRARPATPPVPRRADGSRNLRSACPPRRDSPARPRPAFIGYLTPYRGAGDSPPCSYGEGPGGGALRGSHERFPEASAPHPPPPPPAGTGGGEAPPAGGGS